jgi:hypothetical protein
MLADLVRKSHFELGNRALAEPVREDPALEQILSESSDGEYENMPDQIVGTSDQIY